MSITYNTCKRKKYMGRMCLVKSKIVSNVYCEEYFYPLKRYIYIKLTNVFALAFSKLTNVNNSPLQCQMYLFESYNKCCT